jgi:hypothetical protein
MAAAPLGAAPKERGWNWRETTSPHFAVEHEMPWTPPGFVMNLERMHSRLRMDLGMFSPAMSKERIKLYLYKDSQSFLSGEFQPPSWSNGVALYELKTVAVPDNPDRKALMRVISHETTHLLFEGYWHEAGGKNPPSWLNEGLAMMEENDEPEYPERSSWFQNMVLAKPSSFLPMEQFAALTPAQDLHDPKIVGDFYVQAYSLVYFLFRGHQRLQFKNFCEHLRDGQSLAQSLWLAYRYHGVQDLEKNWRRWRRSSELRNKVDRAQAETSVQTPSEGSKSKDSFTPGFTPMQGFKSLRD